jgi:3-dehydroquinate dehydratase
MTNEMEQLKAIRAEIATMPQYTQDVIALLANRVREAVAKQPLVLTAFSLVAAEMLVLNPEENEE